MGYEADSRWVNCLPENELIRMEKLIRSKGISEEDVQNALNSRVCDLSDLIGKDNTNLLKGEDNGNQDKS